MRIQSMRGAVRKDHRRLRQFQHLVEGVIAGVRQVDDQAKVVGIGNQGATLVTESAELGPSGFVAESAKSLFEEWTRPSMRRPSA